MKVNVKAIAAAVTAILAVSGIAAVSIPVSEKITVKRFSWTYTMDILEYKTKHSSGWSVPKGARVTETRTRELRKEKTLIGVDDKGNNKYIETPIYAPYYEYDYEDWVFKTNIISCANDKVPYYKDYNLQIKEEGVTSVGDEKIGDLHEKYYIHGFNSKNEPVTYEVNRDQWDRIEMGGTIIIKHHRFNDNVLSFDFC